VLTKEEALRVIGYVLGPYALMAKLLYGTGLRLMECLRLRVKDLDFAQQQIVVRDGKGMDNRVTMLPASLVVPLQEHLSRVQCIHAQDLAKGYGSVYLPSAQERKFPRAGRLWMWQYVFPSHQLSRAPRTGTVRRHYASEMVCSGPLAGQVVRQSSPNASVVIPFGTALRRICSSRATISGRCKNSWATKM
jgi:integrase